MDRDTYIRDTCDVIEGFAVRKNDPRAVILQPRKLKGAAAFMRKHRLSAVEISYTFDFEPRDITILRDLPMVTHLSVVHPKLTRGEDLLALGDLRTLTLKAPLRRGLDFAAFPKLVDLELLWYKGFEPPWQCRELRKLDLTYFPHDDLKGIEACQELRWLRLEQCRLLSLEPIASLPHLQTLKLMALRRLRNVEDIAKLKQLEELETYRCCRVQSWAPLAQQPKLRLATLDGSKSLSARDWHWPELREFHLHNADTIDTLTWLSRSKKLEKLFVSDKSRVMDGDFRWIRRCRKLWLLSVDTPKGVQYTPPIEELEEELKEEFEHRRPPPTRPGK